jgi:hypothetical protein
VTEEISDVLDVVVNHRRSFKTETPSNNADIFGKSHRSQHLRSEYTRVSDFNPSLKSRMEPEDFQTRFCVGVVGRLVLKFSNTNLSVELLNDTQKMTETDISVSNETFNLVELS